MKTYTPRVGDIAVFTCHKRKEKYIARVEQSHLGWLGKLKISQATTEQKQKWYESGQKEFVIERMGKSGFMGATMEVE